MADTPVSSHQTWRKEFRMSITYKDENTRDPRNGEECIKGPLRLVFAYRTDDEEKWGFFYQSMTNGKYLHASEEKSITEGELGLYTIKTTMSLVEEDEVVANYFALDSSWVDKVFDGWPRVSQEARDLIRGKIPGAGVIYAPYIDLQINGIDLEKPKFKKNG